MSDPVFASESDTERTTAKDEVMARSASLRAAKKELRSLMKQQLSTITKETLNAQSATVFKSIQGFKPYQASNRIGIYLSMPTREIQTDAIVRHALANGKQVFVPYIHKPEHSPSNTPKSVMDMLELHSLSDYATLEKDSWGIPSLAIDTVGSRESILRGKSSGLDMLFLPGVAFDIDQGSGLVRRLGHGKGFYDFFLHKYRSQVEDKARDQGTDVLLYGLALEEQFLRVEKGLSVPVGEQDSPLHGLFVGDGEIVEGHTNRE